MSKSRRNNAEWPPLLMTSDPATFAYRTIVERKPKIIRQVIADNDYSPPIVQALEAFREEISSQRIRPLQKIAPDADSWNRQLAAYRDSTWLEVPWYFAETFFYRRLLQAVRYFQSGPWRRRDPFERRKLEQIKAAVRYVAEDWGQLESVERDVAFEALLHSCLWGNREDLSNYTVRLQAPGGLMAREQRANILIDHTARVREFLASRVDRVDFVNDNVGVELLFDLALADFILVQGWAQKVVFHLKDHPFFVSDAMPKDVQATLLLLQATPDPAVRELEMRLREHLAAEHLVLQNDPFWTSGLMYPQFPPALGVQLAHSDLIILKGDVNYRRLLSDRHWPHTTSIEDITAYFPAPFLVLRTLKGEIMVGLSPGQAETLAAQDSTWLINGKRGIVQLVTGQGST